MDSQPFTDLQAALARQDQVSPAFFMDWFRLTPESIAALVQVILAAIIAIYLLSRKKKSHILWLLAISLIGETTHHLIKLIAFSVPALYQSATPLLGVSSVLIYVVLLLFAYDFRDRLYPVEAQRVRLIAIVSGAILTGLLLYVFGSALPHDQIRGSKIILYASIVFLLSTAGWTIVVLLRKAAHYRKSDSETGLHSQDLKAARACEAFAVIISLKIIIILAAFLSEVEVIPVGVRIYTNLILHIVYLAGLTVVIIDHIQYPASLQVKLVGLSLVSVLLILSIAGLSIYSTGSLLARSKQFLPDRQTLVFTPGDNGTYLVSRQSFEPAGNAAEPLAFGENDFVELLLGTPLNFFGKGYRTVFIHRNGLISFEIPFEMAPPPVFYMEQQSAPYKSTIHLEAFNGPPFVAPLHMQVRRTEDSVVRYRASSDGLTVIWENFRPAVQMVKSSEIPQATFLLHIYPDGRIGFGYEKIDTYLHEGLTGIFPGYSAGISYFSAEESDAASSTRSEGLIYDFGSHFRTFVHKEVRPLAWLIIGSIVFIVLIFPLALRTSLFRPLDRLLEGAQRIDRGQFGEPVPVLAQDEIGDVAKGFNMMMDSLREAHQKLVRHADRLEEEVELRTDEIRRQKQVLEEQALRLHEMDEIKSRFFANISHEFRTPLNLIMGPIQSILDGDYGPLDEKLIRRHEVMLNESTRLLRLINQLLDLSKLEAGQMEIDLQPANLVSLLHRIAHSFSSRAEMEGKTLTFQSGSDSIVGMVDSKRIEEIGYNLIDNALKFTEPGGKVRISIDVEPGNNAIITIQDTGCGIAVDQLELIFDRFQQVRGPSTSNSQGTGIGLALVQEFVYLHDGTIDVSSEPGFGSTFTIRLPIDPSLQTVGVETSEETAFLKARSNDRIDDAAAVSFRTVPDSSLPLILIVDDEDEFRHFIREYLEEAYRIEEAGNGKAGLESALKKPPHLIVADLLMPEMDGIAFCEAVRRHPDLDHIPFVLLTAKASVESRIEGLERGADAYLSKPVDPRELRTQIQNLLDQRQKLIEKYTELVRLGPEQITVESVDAVLLKQAMEIIESRLSDAAFSVTLLAEELGMSVRDLQRKMKKLLDAGPKELITNLRIERAKQLLAGRAGTVSQIAYKVGFSRPEYFMRIFKQHTGMTPGQFMKEEG